MNFLKTLTAPKLLIILLIFTAFWHLFRLDYPNKYVFDEVYHAFTAKEYLLGHKVAWEWWNTPPPGVAYEWTHPPIAKELMTASMYIMGSTDGWAYRLPGALLGIWAVFLVYKIGITLFKNETVGLISAFAFSLDGLTFVQSRTGMNDIYFVTFGLASLTFFLRDRFFLAALFAGLSLSSKWSALYLLAMYAIIILIKLDYHKIFSTISSSKISFFDKLRGTVNIPYIRFIIFLIIFIPVIYLLSYLPFFILGHSFDQFIMLQKQMWWYHTRLVATHTYASAWWSWPLNLYPVWYFVEYYPDNNMSNIFASGNMAVFLIGFAAIIMTLLDVFKLKKINLIFILLGYFIFLLPWAFSPRIMFLYHYSPSVPFLCLALGYQLKSLLQHPDTKNYAIGGLVLMLVVFFLTYPYLTGIPLPRKDIDYFFSTNLSKNPFK